jgi:8-oxo-dGTP pyrophosphatase MutT (NUDIX family)
MTTRQSLVLALENYLTPYPEEVPFIGRFLDLLSKPGCFQRDHLPGHITGSAWIVNSSATRALMVHHGTLKRWLQPGGHADGEEDILQTARREAFEETGLKDLALVGKCFIDLDIHSIPAKSHFPTHDHYDIRFLFVGDERQSLAISDESTDLQWIDLDALERYNAERAVIRLREKAISSLSAASRKQR